MTGLEMLYTRAKVAERNGNRDLANQLSNIAAEIEQDFHKAKSGFAWRNLSEYMNDLLDGKYRDYGEPGIYRRSDGMETFQEWLDKWYIPRPVDADGEPIRFDKLYDNNCGAIYCIHVSKTNDGYSYAVENCEQHYFPASVLHEQVPDSIEKLRSEMLNLIYASAEEAGSLVDGWLARAEKLFGGDAE